MLTARPGGNAAHGISVDLCRSNLLLSLLFFYFLYRQTHFFKAFYSERPLNTLKKKYSSFSWYYLALWKATGEKWIMLFVDTKRRNFDSAFWIFLFCSQTLNQLCWIKQKRPLSLKMLAFHLDKKTSLCLISNSKSVGINMDAGWMGYNIAISELFSAFLLPQLVVPGVRANYRFHT